MSTDPDLQVFCEPPDNPTFRRAFITGISGQDGSYLTELLLSKGYEVHGLVRRNSVMSRERLDPIRKVAGERRLILHYGDVTESGRLLALLSQIKPHEVYHLAAQSHVRVSFDQPEYTHAVVAGGTLNVLTAVRALEQAVGRRVKVYNAGSSEMFGSTVPPQTEASPFHPRSPYGVAKVAAHWHAVNHRESYGMFVANGILFNHESPRRGEQFVTRKITRAVGRIVHRTQDRLHLGNLNSIRDWGYAGDYVEAMWKMLQAEIADDFVIATGTEYSVRDFLVEAFGRVGLQWQDHVDYDKSLERPAEVDRLCGDASKAQHQLGWSPATDFAALVAMMVEHDLGLARKEAALLDEGPVS
jgi:GDPmannose 4,6-dehydratase